MAFMQFITPRFPVARPRRLRQNPFLRALVRETRLDKSQLVQPLFVRPGIGIKKPIISMPGVVQFSPDTLLQEARALAELGVPAVLLFGIPEKKDAKASGAYAPQGIVQNMVKTLKKEVPGLLVITDVCLCEYMSHGHCGLVANPGSNARILNDATLELLAKTAVSHAQAGADIVAPSDMMDGRVTAIRQALDRRGFQETPIMSYAAKFASAFYGPFREAAESTPKYGDRRSYQMDGANGNEALREVAQDIAEGADIILVKPGIAYLDILWRVKSEFGLPTAAYAVSAEYSMVKSAAEKGWVDERAVALEMLQSFRRAGADFIITYWAKDACSWLS